MACVLTALGVANSTGAATADPLLSQFMTPPDSAKPRVWWHWMDGNVTKEGIRQDLEWGEARRLRATSRRSLRGHWIPIPG